MSNHPPLKVKEMQDYYRKFVKDRSWDKFHTPKNLSMALSVEASELVEIFQWLDEDQSFSVKEDPKISQDIKDELSDILSYLIRIADVLDIDLNKAFWEKVKKNEKKYPIDIAKELVTKLNKLGNKL